MNIIQQAHLRPGACCGGRPRLRTMQPRRAVQRVQCQHRPDSSSDRDRTQQQLLQLGQKVATMAAAAILMVCLLYFGMYSLSVSIALHV